MKSFMFVPGKKKMLSKISVSDADAYIIDLEDSVGDNEKSLALNDVCDYLSDYSNKNIYVRVDKNYLSEEFDKLSAYSFRGYMLPKFEAISDYSDYSQYFKDKEVIALVETPKGLVNIQQIASNDFVSILAFGAEDFTSCIGMNNCAETLMYARSVIVTYGKAYGKKVIDTPSFIINDLETLEKEIQLAVDLGFDGKLSIHPKQNKLINDLFQYYDLDRIKQIIDLYESSGQAVLMIDNKIYEKMHISHYKRVLKENGII